ncbi:UNVERIFIED_CONTAM: hypothetical protein FKN15_020777 [Acipenser sinensis]
MPLITMNTDQDTWSLDFKNCSGKSQSPINIDTRAAIFTPALPPIVLQGYDLSDEEKLTLQNNGHTLQLSLPDTMRIVRGFDNVFVAAQLHFHWGTVKVPGSEHTVDGLHFPAEIHVVHYNTKYDNLSEAASKPDGLAVLGAFIELSELEDTLKAGHDTVLSKNFRAPQLLYGRRVLSSFEALSSPGGVSSGGTEDTSSGKSSKRGTRLGSGEDSSEKDLTDKETRKHIYRRRPRFYFEKHYALVHQEKLLSMPSIMRLCKTVTSTEDNRKPVKIHRFIDMYADAL